ncbi:iron-sulfur protein [Actinokineospora bangkokensis]|uniref:Iron-sulfur protein n=1 Tax=Actinokineospora bangkokensis TaxID=1193682 RepID=A0A1Q9LDZ8_9PSEU|nr:iron-sulfur protein [Actinokineospora bangkokensis]
MAASLARIDPQQGRVELRHGDQRGVPGWRTCADFLADPGAFGSWRAGLAAWLDHQYGESPDRTTAGYVMSWYLWVPGYVAGLLFHHERRVPSLRPEHLAFRMAEPRPHPEAIAVLTPGFTCLPDDPDAGDPHATAVPDEQALAAVLRGRFTAHAARFVEVFADQARFGRRMLWSAATDALDNALWLAGRYGGDERAGVADAALVLADGPRPLTAPSTLRQVVAADGSAEWTRRRESCCFHYLLDRGQGTCSTCPRLSRRGG